MPAGGIPGAWERREKSEVCHVSMSAASLSGVDDEMGSLWNTIEGVSIRALQKYLPPGNVSPDNFGGTRVPANFSPTPCTASPGGDNFPGGTVENWLQPTDRGEKGGGHHRSNSDYVVSTRRTAR